MEKIENLDLFRRLETVLSKNSNYIAENKILLKNMIVESALNMRQDLIQLLLTDEKLKAIFFISAGGFLIFDKVKFQRFVMNKEFLPDSYTSYKNKIGLADENYNFISKSREVVLNWPYKDCILEGGQTKEDARKNEVFYNELLAPDEITKLTAPKVFTNFVKYDKDGEHPVESISDSDNLLIKGNNLLVLYSLLKRFRGKIKLIYIDPPYNTGNDSFLYNDRFNHSSWLTFMKNRLQVAKDLLREDGCIFVQCDDNEQAYLKVLMDEVFGRKNFICIFIRKTRYGGGFGSSDIGVTHDYIVSYAKERNKTILNNVSKDDKEISSYFNKNDQYGKYHSRDLQQSVTQAGRRENRPLMFFPILIKGNKLSMITKEEYDKIYKNNLRFDDDYLNQLHDYYNNKGFTFELPYLNSGEYGRWTHNFDSVCNLIKEHKIGFDNFRIFVKERLDVTRFNKVNITIFDDSKVINATTSNIFKTYNFDYSKPEYLLYRLIDIATAVKNDIVLDFCLGSGTTAVIAHQMGRQYIGVEQMDYFNNIPVKRVKKVIDSNESEISKLLNWQGGGSFIRCELKRANQIFVDDLKNAETIEEVKQIWQNICEAGFVTWHIDMQTINEHLKNFEGATVEDAKNFCYDAIDKNMLYVNYDEIDSEEFNVSEHDKKINKLFYEAQDDTGRII